jgi:hypothetical protein
MVDVPLCFWNYQLCSSMYEFRTHKLPKFNQMKWTHFQEKCNFVILDYVTDTEFWSQNIQMHHNLNQRVYAPEYGELLGHYVKHFYL